MTRISEIYASDFGNDEKEYIDYLMKLKDIKTLIINSDVELDCEGLCLAGTLIQSDKYLYPIAGGFDIGCGVALYRLVGGFDINLFDKLFNSKRLFGIKRKKYSTENKMSDNKWNQIISSGLNRQWLGEIEEGNHFIEICKGDDDNYYILIHSGVAEYIKMLVLRLFLMLYRKHYGEGDNETNGYVLRINKHDIDAKAYLENCETIRLYAQKNREYIAKKIADNIDIEIEYILDSPHQFITMEDKTIIHANAVQRFALVDNKKTAIILCGKGKQNVVVEGIGEKQFINHGTKLVQREGTKRVYGDIQDILLDVEFKDNLKIKSILTPVISCKKERNIYEYQVF